MHTLTPQENLNLHLAESKAANFLDPTFAAYMDDRDPLKALRGEFVIPTRGEIAPGKTHFTPMSSSFIHLHFFMSPQCVRK